MYLQFNFLMGYNNSIYIETLFNFYKFYVWIHILKFFCKFLRNINFPKTKWNIIILWIFSINLTFSINLIEKYEIIEV